MSRSRGSSCPLEGLFELQLDPDSGDGRRHCPEEGYLDRKRCAKGSHRLRACESENLGEDKKVFAIKQAAETLRNLFNASVKFLCNADGAHLARAFAKSLQTGEREGFDLAGNALLRQPVGYKGRREIYEPFGGGYKDIGCAYLL